MSILEHHSSCSGPIVGFNIRHYTQPQDQVEEPYYEDQYDQYDKKPISIVTKQQPINNPQPPIVSDEILKRLNYMELKVNKHEKFKFLYTTICNERIHPSVPTNTYPYKFEIPNIDKF